MADNPCLACQNLLLSRALQSCPWRTWLSSRSTRAPSGGLAWRARLSEFPRPQIGFVAVEHLLNKASVSRHWHRNCAFVQEAHPLLLSSGKVNFLPYILLPLCGPEEFDLEEQEKFPDELQLLPPDKQREGDSKIRLMLVETLILLCATRQGREELRNKGVYEIVKVTHKVEPDDEVRVAIERLVNLLMRGEPEEEKIQEINGNGASQAQQDEDEDAMVQEV